MYKAKSVIVKCCKFERNQTSSFYIAQLKMSKILCKQWKILISLDSSSALKVLHANHVHGCLATLDCNGNSDYPLNNSTCHNSKKGIGITEIPPAYVIA